MSYSGPCYWFEGSIMANLFLAYKCEFFEVTEAFHAELVRTFPYMDIYEQYDRMALWLLANPRNRKTPRGMPRFIAGWLARIPKPKIEEARRELAAGSGPRSELEMIVCPACRVTIPKLGRRYHKCEGIG